MELFVVLGQTLGPACELAPTAAVRENKPCSLHFAPFRSVWEQLSLLETDNANPRKTLIVLDNRKIVVPVRARADILRRLHQAHQGQGKSLQQARQLYYWPNMKHDFVQQIEACHQCQLHRTSQAVKPIAIQQASMPMDSLGCDLFDCSGKKYIVLVDRYSGYPFMTELKKTTTEAVTTWLESIF